MNLIRVTHRSIGEGLFIDAEQLVFLMNFLSTFSVL